MEIEYGKWYDCGEVMPENFGIKREVIIHITGEDYHSFTFPENRHIYVTAWRWEYSNGKYQWRGIPENILYGRRRITHWMAIPPIKIEF